jgi:hypothetical protein
MNRKNSLFTSVPVMKVPRNLFDLSHEVKLSAKFTYLYPVLVQETLPGGTYRDLSTIMVRLAPMLAPIMHRLDVTTHFFFVPYRLIWDGWQTFITRGQDGTESRVPPYFTPAGLKAQFSNVDWCANGSLWDYLGLPTFTPGSATLNNEKISSLPFQAYGRIWNDWYRDPNFDPDIEADLQPQLDGDISAYGNMIIRGGNDGAGPNLGLLNRMWQKDYFTSALPFAQRGTEVLMPLSAYGQTIINDPGTYVTGRKTDLGGGIISGEHLVTDASGHLVGGTLNQQMSLVGQKVEVSSSNVSINDLRTSLALQRWMENNARSGPRYIEQIQAHFGVRPSDYRLQRTEYLGGGKQPIQVSPVVSTAKTTNDAETTPVGDLAGYGISVGKSNQFSYRCEEHGVIIGIMSVTPQSAYQQGVDKMWSRREWFDYAFPELANLGEQEILSKEVFYDILATGDTANQETFGYIPRFADYKFKNDRVAGDFRDSLRFWHLGRIFGQRPVLSASFTTALELGNSDDNEEETMRRIFAVEDGTDYLWIDIFHRFTAKLPLPYYGVPRILG